MNPIVCPHETDFEPYVFETASKVVSELKMHQKRLGGNELTLR